MGWFALQINFITEGILQVLRATPLSFKIPAFLLNLFLGILMTGATLFGIRGLGFISKWSIPLLVGTLLFVLYQSKDKVLLEPKIFTLSGISIVIAIAIGAVSDFPTYFRHARSKKEGFLAVILLFTLIMPLIESIGIYLGTHSTHGDLLETLLQGGGFLWSFWIACFLLLTGWMTNNTNLYSAGTNSLVLLPKLSFIQRTLLIGFLGTLISSFNILSHFVFSLEFMGTMVASFGAVLMVSYQRKELHASKEQYIACLVGFTAGILSLTKTFELTQAPILDSFLGSFVVALGLAILRRKNETFAKG
jgi:purine-cytosine permease-like protein